MERRTRKRKPRLLRRWSEWSRRWTGRVTQAAIWCCMQVRAAWRAVATRLRPWRPVVLVDAKRGRARRLRRMLNRATRAQFRALDVPHPDHLLIVVQRTVEQEERQLGSLLQVFETEDHVRRHVLFLALAVEGEAVGDGTVVAALRQQLHEVVGEALGELVCAVPGERARKQRPAPSWRCFLRRRSHRPSTTRRRFRTMPTHPWDPRATAPTPSPRSDRRWRP